MTNDCGCCSTPAAAIPAAIANRPGLSAIAYRMGTFATFRKAILDELSHTPRLAGLAARVSEDYTITLIELWAAVADVLSFYQERTANEAYMRTATQRDSVLRLARLIDYALRPGVAATTHLAFTLEAGATTLIAGGTRVKSVPGEAEKAQTFETSMPVMADSRLNKLRVLGAPFPAAPTSPGTATAIFAPDADALLNAATLGPSDRVMLYSPSAIETLTVREVFSRDDLLMVSWNLPLAGTSFGAAYDASDSARRAYKLGRAFHLFGFDAPETSVVPERKKPLDATTTYLTTALTNYSLHGDGTSATQIALDGRYPGLKAGSVVLAVSTLTGGLIAIPFEVTKVSEKFVSRTGTTTTLPVSSATTVTVASGTTTLLDLSPMSGLTLANLLPTGDIRDVTIYELVGSPLRFWPFAYPALVASSHVFIPGRRAGWSAMEGGRSIEKGVAKPGTLIDIATFIPGRAVLLADEKRGIPVSATLANASFVGLDVNLDPTSSDTATIQQLGLQAQQATPLTVIVSRSLGSTFNLPAFPRELTVTLGALPAQTISLDPLVIGPGAIANVASALQAALRAALPGAPTYSRALAWVIDDAIVVAPGVPGDRVSFGPSINDPETLSAIGLDAASARFLDGWVSLPATSLLGVPVNGSVRVTIGAEQPADKPIAVTAATLAVLAAALRTAFGTNTLVTADNRVVVLPPLPPREIRSFLRVALNVDAPFALDASSAVLLGNVAPATHGETVRNEVVGDGDAAQAFQRFTLKKKPVTYIPAATPGGAASTLRILVNGTKWMEAETLYGASPRDEIYVARIADDGTLTVQFGDGVTGARVPTGRQNIVAWYRQGIGVAGRVGAGKLTTLLDRPTGVRNAINLNAADGGAEPELAERARQAAPGTVRTFGRAVSLRDFEDTALMAGEVAKALATWVWNGERRVIHLTIAAQDGAIFSADGLKRIAATLATERDPNHKLLIDNYTPVAILVDASILVDDRYLAASVLASARDALLLALSFAERDFAAPVYLSDIYRILQDVEGVVAVDVNTLDLKSTDIAFRTAHGVDDTLPQPQARLLMFPARPAGSTGTVLPAELAWIEVPSEDVTLTATGGLAS